MKHVPFFRWVVALGLVLIGCAVGVYAASDYPELEQVDLTVLREDTDGACTVRWTDPFELGEHVGPYRCDPDRDDILKAPDYKPGTNLGWDSGWVLAEGPHKGELYSLDEDEDTDESLRVSDQLLVAGVLLTIVGVIGGNIRSLSRLSGVSPAVVRRARRLREVAAQVAKDHARAVAAVRKAWAPLHEELVSEQLGRIPVARLRKATRERLPVTELERNGIRTVRDVLEAGTWGVAHASGLGRRDAEKVWAAARRTADSVGQDTTVRLDADRPDAPTVALLNALRVLVEAGPATRRVAERGGRLAATLEAGLADAAPASGWRPMLDAGREERKAVPTAVAELRSLLYEAERDGVAQQFAQASVDLLRGADGDPAGLCARVDFDTRPAEYYALLADVASTALRGTADTPG
ncbi:hypothetical protein ACGH7X_22235 [Streptomyces sp. BBFR51]|uniref:hypothetical protein n=1 Tax=Streptomyces sp. BBFR51 TaxID=3372856 RepID=UPI0037DC247B